MVYQFPGLFFFFRVHVCVCTHISILEYYRNRLIRNSLSWTTLMRIWYGTSILSPFCEKSQGERNLAICSASFIVFHSSDNVLYHIKCGGLPFLKKKTNNQTPQNPKKFATVGSLSSFHLLLYQWHSVTDSTLGILVY